MRTYLYVGVNKKSVDVEVRPQFIPNSLQSSGTLDSDTDPVGNHLGRARAGVRTPRLYLAFLGSRPPTQLDLGDFQVGRLVSYLAPNPELLFS